MKYKVDIKNLVWIAWTYISASEFLVLLGLVPAVPLIFIAGVLHRVRAAEDGTSTAAGDGGENSLNPTRSLWCYQALRFPAGGLMIWVHTAPRDAPLIPINHVALLTQKCAWIITSTCCCCPDYSMYWHRTETSEIKLLRCSIWLGILCLCLLFVLVWNSSHLWRYFAKKLLNYSVPCLFYQKKNFTKYWKKTTYVHIV